MNRARPLCVWLALLLVGCIRGETLRPVHDVRTHLASEFDCDLSEIDVSPLGLPFFEDPFFTDHAHYRARGCGHVVDFECPAFGASQPCVPVHPYETAHASTPQATVRWLSNYPAAHTYAAREEIHVGNQGRIVRAVRQGEHALGISVAAEPAVWRVQAAQIGLRSEQYTYRSQESCGSNCTRTITGVGYRSVKVLEHPCHLEFQFRPSPGGSYRIGFAHAPRGQTAVQAPVGVTGPTAACEVACVRDDGGVDRACEGFQPLR